MKHSITSFYDRERCMTFIRANVWTKNGASSHTFFTVGEAHAWINMMKRSKP